MASSVVANGPYRATKLWNQIVSLFNAGMPLKRHRQRFRTFNDCFTGSDAVEWLHALLKSNVNFGPHVSRKQTFLLLNKFLKNHVIEDVHGRWGEETFTDNGRLFKFPANKSPLKGLREPFAPVSNNVNSAFNLQESTKNPPIKPRLDCVNKENVVSPTRAKLKKSTPKSPNSIWKSTFLSCLKRILHLQHFDGISYNLKVNVDWLKHNSTSCDRSGLVLVSGQEDIPCWVISAMKCLSDWPDNRDTGFPNYEGFERDVFKAIVEYFNSASEPLLTFDLYDVFLTVLLRCRLLDEMCTGSRHSVALENHQEASEPSQSKSSGVSDRIHKQLLQAQMRHENLAQRKQRSMRKTNKQLFTREEFPSSRQDVGINEDSKINNSHINQRFAKSDIRLPYEHGYRSGDHFTKSSRPRSLHSDHMYGASIESLPNVLDHEDVWRRDGNNLKKQASLHKSDGNLLTSRDFDVDEVVGEEEIFSSVEDLLLNMSVSVVDPDLLDCHSNLKKGDPAHPAHMSKLDAVDLWRRGPVPQSSRSRKMKMDGFRVKEPEKNSCDSYSAYHPLADEDTLRELDGEAGFTHYIKKKTPAAPPRVVVDNYATLPWHMERRNTRDSTNAGHPFQKQRSRYGGEVVRTKSDIVARREIPPSVRNINSEADQERRSRIPLSTRISSVANDISSFPSNRGCHKRLSKSYSNLTRNQPKEGDHQDLVPTIYHGSMDVLNRAGWDRHQDTEVTQSPLSVALEQARMKFKSIAAKKAEPIHTIEAFQLCLLLLPPANRRKLHLLLRLMTKMMSNPSLTGLDDHLSIRTLLIERFTDAIIRPSEHPDCSGRNNSEKVTAFFVDHAATIMKTNERFEGDIQRALQPTEEGNCEVLRDGEAGRGLKKQFTFCKQVSRDEYEKHNGSDLDKALSDLLEALLDDQSIPVREKKKRLKQFQRSYPRIYEARFPLGDPLTNERKPRFSGAIRKLRNLRL